MPKVLGEQGRRGQFPYSPADGKPRLRVSVMESCAVTTGIPPKALPFKGGWPTQGRSKGAASLSCLDTARFSTRMLSEPHRSATPYLTHSTQHNLSLGPFFPQTPALTLGASE